MDQTLHINPTKEDRKRTDTPFIFVIVIIFIIWVIITIKASSYGLIQETDRINHPIILVIEAILLGYSWTFSGYTIVSGLLAYLYIYTLSRHDGKLIIDVAVYLICVLMVTFVIASLVYLAVYSDYIPAYWMFILSLIFAPYLITSFVCARNIGNKVIFEIVRDSCRAILHSWSILAFAFAMSVMIVVIASFAIYVFICLIFEYFIAQMNPIAIHTYIYINISTAAILILFLMNFIHIVVSGYVIDWFWMKDQLSGSLPIQPYIIRAFRYHFGTLVFASLPPLSHLCSLFQACRCRDGDKDVVKIYNIVTRFFSQVCVFIHALDFALIQTSIYGHGYTTAISTAHDLVAHNNHDLNLAVSGVLYVLALIGYVLILILFACQSLAYSLFSVVIPFTVVFTSAVRALLVNKMIMDSTAEALKKEHDSTQKAVLPVLETTTV